MKIGLVTGEFPPMEGGVGAFTQELAKAMAAQGHELHIFTSREARPDGTSRSLTSLFEPIEIPYGLLYPRGRRWQWRDVGLIADMAIRSGLDIVNVQYQAAAYNMRNPAINFMPFRLNGICKTVATFHDLRTPYLFPKAGPLRQWVVRRLASGAHGAIVTNQADEEALKGKVTALRQIPIGSNIAVFPADSQTLQNIRANLGLTANDFLLGYFGFLHASKGADDLIEAVSMLPENVHLVFIGGRTGASDPNNNASFASLLDQLIAVKGVGHRVHFTGFLPNDMASYHLAAVDLMVMPYRDGVSLRRGTLMAALAHGRPIITTEPAARSRVLSSSDGVYLTPRADVVALKVAICEFMDRPDERAALGKRALALSAQFGWDSIARQTVNFYKSL